MVAEQLIRGLESFNTHWVGGPVSLLVRRSERRRRSFRHIRRRLEELPFEVIAGPRQVGKTTLLGHLIEDLIASGTPPNRILYAPLDFPPVSLELDGHLDNLVAAFERFVLQSRILDAPGRVYFLLDEIHTLPDWGAEMKGLFDAYNPNLRVVATGSSSAALLNAPSADFAGRVERSHIHPLKLSEVVENRDPSMAALLEQARNVRVVLGRVDGTPASRANAATAIEALYIAAKPASAAIERAVDDYAVRGGYPLAQPPSREDQVFRFFESTLDTVLSKDLKLYEKVRKPGAFRSFLAKMASENGGKFVSSSYATSLGLDKETPALWKVVAEELFLVHQLPQLNETFHPVVRKADKAYFQDPGIRAFLTARTRLDGLEQTGEIGEVIEGILFDHLRRFQFNILGHRGGVLGYWNKPEVDFIVQTPGGWIAVEAKYRANPRSATSRLRTEFERRPDVLKIVATRDSFDVAHDPWLLPTWLLLLVC